MPSSIDQAIRTYTIAVRQEMACQITPRELRAAYETFLTAYAAQAADSKRLDHLDITRQDVIQDPIWDGDEPRLIARAWGIHGECDTIREAIDNAMLGMEAPAS